MSRLHLTFIATLAIFTVASGQEPSSERKIPWANKFFTGDKSPPPPVILQDFGTLPSGTIKTYRFKMTNIYAYTVEVKVGNPSCGCTSVLEYTGKMEPRQSGTIQIKVDTSRVEGQKNVKIPVRFDVRDPKSTSQFWSLAELEVRVNSRRDISITPGAIEFGLVPVGQKAAQSTTILYSGNQANWQIKEVGYKKDMFQVAVKPIRVAGGLGYKVTTTLLPTIPAGRFDEQIVLKTSDGVLMVNVNGTMQSPLSVFGLDPGGVLKMGGVPLGKKSFKSLIFRAEKAFKIKSVDGLGDGITAPLLPLDANKSGTLEFTFTPTKIGPVRKVLTVTTDTGEKVTITVEGIGTEP